MIQKDKTKEDINGQIKLLQERVVELETADAERKQQSEIKFRTLVGHISKKIFIKNNNSVYLFCNSNYADDLKIKPEEIIGKTDIDLFPEKLAEKYRAEDKRIIETGEPEDIEEKYIEHGEEKWVHIVKTPYRDEKDKIIGVLGILRDITEKKRAEERLKEYAAQLEEQKKLLEQKNLALSELIAHMERTKNKIKEDIARNVEEFIAPALKRLRLKGASRKYLDLLQHHLAALTASFGRRITARSARLSPREVEIAGMIKGGLSSKETSELLDISYHTVDKHRRDIRKKLGISKKKVNLTSYLQRL